MRPTTSSKKTVCLRCNGDGNSDINMQGEVMEIMTAFSNLRSTLAEDHQIFGCGDYPMNMKVEYLTNKVQETKLRWYGHVLKTK